MQYVTINDERFLVWPLDAHKLKQQSNLQLLLTEKLIQVDESTTKLAGNGSTQGTGPAALNR